MIGARYDALVYGALRGRRERAAARWPEAMRWHDTAAGRLRIYDSGGDGPPVVMAPDGPCVVEHYDRLIDLLRDDFRVVIFDLPGFGFSAPRRDYGHRLAEGGGAITAVLEALDLRAATLALSCVNGFYALAAAQMARPRVSRLVLSQTPGIDAMRVWTQRVVPSPIGTPLLGQMLNFASRRRIAKGWYRVAVADAALHEPFTRVARQSLRQGGCFCFAGVVQGMATTDDADPLLRAPADLPVTLIWGGKDRSHRHTDPASLHRHCPHAELVRWKDVGHFPELEAPEDFAELLQKRCLQHSGAQ